MLPLVELVALYAGEMDDGGVELTRACPSIPLAVEICRAVSPSSLAELVKAIYGEMPADQLDDRQARLLGIGFNRWQRMTRLGGL